MLSTYGKLLIPSDASSKVYLGYIDPTIMDLPTTPQKELKSFVLYHLLMNNRDKKIFQPGSHSIVLRDFTNAHQLTYYEFKLRFAIIHRPSERNKAESRFEVISPNPIHSNDDIEIYPTLGTLQPIQQGGLLFKNHKKRIVKIHLTSSRDAVSEFMGSKKARHLKPKHPITDRNMGYLIMRMLPGQELCEALSYVEQEQDIDDYLTMSINFLLALQIQVHSYGLAHRDIATRNIIKDGDDLFIIDYEIADYVRTLKLTTPLPQFAAKNIAPEVRIGIATKQSDIYSAATVIHEIVAENLDELDAEHQALLGETLEDMACEKYYERPSLSNVIDTIEKIRFERKLKALGMSPDVPMIAFAHRTALNLRQDLITQLVNANLLSNIIQSSSAGMNTCDNSQTTHALTLDSLFNTIESSLRKLPNYSPAVLEFFSILNIKAFLNIEDRDVVIQKIKFIKDAFYFWMNTLLFLEEKLRILLSDIYLSYPPSNLPAVDIKQQLENVQRVLSKRTNYNLHPDEVVLLTERFKNQFNIFKQQSFAHIAFKSELEEIHQSAIAGGFIVNLSERPVETEVQTTAPQQDTKKRKRSAEDRFFQPAEPPLKRQKISVAETHSRAAPSAP